ncbi:MAG TPA: endonuclease/exonuclease/phosphatase family protein [Methylophilaceae bacterium]|nr:endonuclease/exonuclease/phosphatase family protein [Methylophilaceae bacterium]
MNRSLRIATYNIHKGLSSFNARLVLDEQRKLIRHLHADIVFLQEVRGAHSRHSGLFSGGQYEFLADSIWSDFAYGKNAVQSDGHHGNAILSKYPIAKWENEDISAHVTEQRGLLHCEIAIPGWDQHLHCICVHLGLFSHWRSQQLASLKARIHKMVPANAPLIIAGDFNDWRQKVGTTLASDLNLREVFEHANGKPARSFPSIMPLFRLDRIYTRGFHVQHSQVHGGLRFGNASDHAALSAVMVRDVPA